MQNENELKAIAAQMVAPSKGLLAADESAGTANKRLASVNVTQDEEHRRQYRELFLEADDIEQYISGVILYDETLHQKADSGLTFVEALQKKGIIPGIKVDAGTKDFALFPGELITDGLDGLRDRLKGYYALGCRFTKWRAVITIDETKGLPTEQCIAANVHALARYAGLSQEQGLVPVVEPEVLLEGKHSSKKAEEVTTHVLTVLFAELAKYNVYLPGTVLKTSMVVPARDSGEAMDTQKVAEMTTRCLHAAVPKELGGVVFLSGGQSALQATQNLHAVNMMGPHPWPVSFSYARALQGPPLKIWSGDPAKVAAAREEFLVRCKLTSAARDGKYNIADDDLA